MCKHAACVNMLHVGLRCDQKMGRKQCRAELHIVCCMLACTKHLSQMTKCAVDKDASQGQRSVVNQTDANMSTDTM